MADVKKTKNTGVQKGLKKTGSGKPLTPNEIKLLASLYCAEIAKPTNRGVTAKVLRAYENEVKNNKAYAGYRPKISRVTIIRVLKNFDLEPLRQENRDKLRKEFQDGGFNKIHDDLQEIVYLRKIVFDQIVKDPSQATVSDYCNLLRTQRLIMGEPDSRPDNSLTVNQVINKIEPLNDAQLKEFLRQNQERSEILRRNANSNSRLNFEFDPEDS